MPAEILIHNLVVFGAALIGLLVVAFMGARVASLVVRAVLRRLDASDEQHKQWNARVTRVFVLGTMLIALLLLGVTALLTWYGESAAMRLWEQIRPLLEDPMALLWATLELVGGALAAVLLYIVTLRVMRVGLARLGRVIDGERHGKQLELLGARLHTALRAILGVGLLVFVVGASPAAETLQYPLSVLTFAVVGFVASRVLVTVAHLVVEVLFDAGETTGRRNVVFRYTGRLGRLATVTRYALDYFIYVATTTIVVDHLTPDTPLASLGLMLLRVIGILYLTRVVVEVFEVTLREIFSLSEDEADHSKRHQRATLIPVATSLARYVAYILGGAIALSEMGVDTTPLLAAASLVGVAVGLGAQAIVSDLVGGFFILFEGVFLVGHRIRVNDVDGIVEEIGVRMTKIRDNYGILHCIPNGEIRGVASFSHEYVNAVVEFGLPYEIDVPAAFATLAQHFADIRSSHPDVTGDTEIIIEQLRESCVWVRAVTRVKPGKDDEMQEVFRLEIVKALAAARLPSPYERRRVELVERVPHA